MRDFIADAAKIVSIADENGNGSLELVCVEQFNMANGLSERITFLSVMSAGAELILSNPYSDGEVRLRSGQLESENGHSSAYYVVDIQPFVGEVVPRNTIVMPVVVAVSNKDEFTVSTSVVHPYREALLETEKLLEPVRAVLNREMEVGDYYKFLKLYALQYIVEVDVSSEVFALAIEFAGKEVWDRDTGKIVEILREMFS